LNFPTKRGQNGRKNEKMKRRGEKSEEEIIKTKKKYLWRLKSVGFGSGF